MRANARAPAARRLRWPFDPRCSCGRWLPEGVRRCSSRTCPEYAPTWARDTRRRLFVNLEQLKLSVMFSVTAPGADQYPFDRRFCSHSASTRCSGPIGCRVAPDAALAFNRAAGKWWSELHRAAKTRGRSLRHSRRLWASRNLAADPPRVTLDEWHAAAAMLSTRRAGPARAP
jgi:hypothetical protein